jgi:putative spermidine/putrescine transport system permease protein
MQYVGVFKAYEPAALAIISFALTWLVMLIMQWVGHSSPAFKPVAGIR